MFVRKPLALLLLCIATECFAADDDRNGRLEPNRLYADVHAGNRASISISPEQAAAYLEALTGDMGIRKCDYALIAFGMTGRPGMLAYASVPLPSPTQWNETTLREAIQMLRAFANSTPGRTNHPGG